MPVEAWALFCLTELVLCLQPGPSAFVVVSQSLTRGPSAGVRVTVGVLAANAIYFALSASGLIALHTLSAEVFSLIKWCGAAYLAWLGVRLIARSFGSRRAARPSQEPGTSGSAFWRGFVTQGANPDLLVYFTAILPQFIQPGQALAPQVALLAVSSFVIEFTVLSAYAGFSGRAGEVAAPRFRTLLERAGGVLLLGAAAGLARLQRESSR